MLQSFTRSAAVAAAFLWGAAAHAATFDIDVTFDTVGSIITGGESPLAPPVLGTLSFEITDANLAADPNGFFFEGSVESLALTVLGQTFDETDVGAISGTFPGFFADFDNGALQSVAAFIGEIDWSLLLSGVPLLNLTDIDAPDIVGIAILGSVDSNGVLAPGSATLISQAAPVPLPASLPLLTLGFGGLWAVQRKRSRR